MCCSMASSKRGLTLSTDLVKLLVELLTVEPARRNERALSIMGYKSDYESKIMQHHLQLSSLGHGLPLHQERGLDLLEALALEVIQTVVDHSLVEVDTISSEEEPSVARDLGSCLSAASGDHRPERRRGRSAR